MTALKVIAPAAAADLVRRSEPLEICGMARLLAAMPWNRRATAAQ